MIFHRAATGPVDSRALSVHMCQATYRGTLIYVQAYIVYTVHKRTTSNITKTVLPGTRDLRTVRNIIVLWPSSAKQTLIIYPPRAGLDCAEWLVIGAGLEIRHPTTVTGHQGNQSTQTVALSLLPLRRGTAMHAPICLGLCALATTLLW